MDQLNPLFTLISTISAALSAVAAAWAIIAQKRSQSSKEVLDQAILSLERAYESLTEGATPQPNIVPDRLNWLTTARHLQSYKALKGQLKRNVHKTICEEHEEYWRHRFYLLLNKPNITSPRYYAENVREGKAPIEIRSALIVHGFANWPRNKPDPIDSVDEGKLLQESDPLVGNIGLQIHLRNSGRYRHLVGDS